MNNLGKIQVDPDVEYITQWVDQNNQFVFDRFLINGRLIVNKKVTGCGFTTYCLFNKENTILVSPRKRLIKDKLKQFNMKLPLLYYFDRDQRKGVRQRSFQDLSNELYQYLKTCYNDNRPFKLMVTYDSFINLVSMLERDFQFDISSVFRIVIDESHTIIKDVKLKEYSNKCVLSDFIKCLFRYQKLLFVSATPIIDYIGCIPEFCSGNVCYVELEWSNIRPVIVRSYGCKNATDAFDQIYKKYSTQQDPYCRNYFDVIHYGDGRSAYSYEAVIFLNSIADIKKIVNKYVNKLGVIDINDISVICAETDENARSLHATHPKLDILESIPKEGDKHMTWTFVTRTAFEGVDFCSPCASTYVIANYNVESLSIDIASDIPQIIGRQRLKSNVFRNTINIFYTNSQYVIDDHEFQDYQKRKMKQSQVQIAIWNDSKDDYKETVLDNLNCKIEKNPNDLYLKTVNGIPEIDALLIISENYCRDVLKNQITWYSIQSPQNGLQTYCNETEALRGMLANASSCKKEQERIKYISDYLSAFPGNRPELFRMLYNEGYTDIAYYFNTLPIDRIVANGYDPWKIRQEIEYLTHSNGIKALVSETFEQGHVYSRKEAKTILQELYDRLRINKTAKATDLENYLKIRIVKKNGLKAYKIL